MATDLARLRRVLGGPDTARLLARLRERLISDRPLTGSIRIADPTPAERAAIDGLLGRKPGGAGSVTVPLAGLAKVLSHSGIHTGDLAGAVIALTGPITTRAAATAAAEQSWALACAPGASLAADLPALAAWWERLRDRGTLRRVSGNDPDIARQLLTDTHTVLTSVPTGREALPVFAARVLGNAHRLDSDQPVTGLIVSALTALSDLPDTADRRTVWASAGIVVDELSSRVLTLGLSAEASTPAGRAVGLWRETGQPLVLTLRQLITDPPVFAPGPRVYLCENPSVVAAAADRLGPGCPPLICTEGQPGAAVTTLLDQLAATGAELVYHGDFDWPGIAIATFLRRRYAWRPWRFGATDYLAAVPDGALATLRGTPRETPWDPALRSAMSTRDAQIEEEHVIDDLLSDLTRQLG
ncbi:TIGR02679 family protein [Nocardia thailandica]